MKKPKFLRRNSSKYSKLGRKRKQTWRNPTGRHNKMREKRKGYPAIVSVGYRTEKNSRGKINGKDVIVVMNLKDAEKITKNEIALIGKIGKKKRIEIVNSLKKKNVEIANRNIGKMTAEKKKELKSKITVEEAKKIIEEEKK